MAKEHHYASCKTRALEGQYLIAAVDRAATTFPRAERDLLIDFASSSAFPSGKSEPIKGVNKYVRQQEIPQQKGETIGGRGLCRQDNKDHLDPCGTEVCGVDEPA